jgi:alkanesulfonate monooxygenase SsuD/methylene tetrahydromethanopterin reductase-like flavin-dependent oxidoreductase (luciferase family)
MTARSELGWIVQPALFETPAATDPGAASIAHDLIAADDRHVALAREAGFDTIWVEDHMGWGDKAHLECFTTMAWLAGRHPGLRYGTMVCGQAFRNPAYLAKLAVAMQILTDDSFILGIGAGNNPTEHLQFGYHFPPPRERLHDMEEAITIIQALWAGPHATVTGQHYTIENATVAPRPERPIPLMIGGGGERVTLRLVARYADWWCADVGTVEAFARKSRILDEHCREIGRDPAEVTRSQATWVSVEEDSDRATRWPDLHIVAGTPEEVTRELRAFQDAGVQHFQLRFMDFPETAGMERFVSRVLPHLHGHG